jgi:hypothetical protein
MVTVVDVVGLLVILGVNTVTAALLTRLLRVRMNTRWGAMLYAFVLGGFVLLVFTIALGAIGLGPNLGSATVVVGLAILLPLSVGVAFDYFWMPAPEDVELPAKYRT